MNRLFSVLVIISIIFSGLLPVHAEGADLSKEEKDVRIGHLLDHYMTEAFVMLRDEGLREKISETVNKIVKAAGKPDNSFRLRLINHTLPIVTSYPGYVYVSSGMLDILESEAELAAVLAHAIAHTNEGDQNQAYVHALRSARISDSAGLIVGLLVFSGNIIPGAAFVAGGVALTSTSIESISMFDSGILSTESINQGVTSHDARDKRTVLNRLIPHINLPDRKSKLSVLVFFGDLYGGYSTKEETEADKLAIGYLEKTGYEPDIFISVLTKLSKTTNDFIARGYMSHIYLANPGLEKRIENAQQVIDHSK